MEKHFAA